MPSYQYKLVSIGLTTPPEPDTEHLKSLKLIWPLLDKHLPADATTPTAAPTASSIASGGSDPLVGLRCLKAAATSTTPVTNPLLTVPSDIAGKIKKIVSPSDPSLTFALVVVLLDDGRVMYLSSSKRFHMQFVSFVPTNTAKTVAEGPAAPTSSSTTTTSAATDSVKIVDIAAGATHLLACDATGHAWAWGWGNEWGQFGQGNLWKSLVALRGGAADGVVGGGADAADTAADKLKAAASHVVSGIVAALVREKGTDDESITIAPPSHIKAFGPTYGRVGVSAVAAGRYHSIFLTDNKRNVFTCGWGERGQLGQGKSVALTPTPRSIMRLFGCAVAAVAAASGGDHTHLLLESGKVLAFGDNTTGVLGTGTHHAEWTPSRIAFQSVADGHGGLLSGGETSSAALGIKGLAGIKDLCVANAKHYTATQAPYGTPESFLYPRRVQQITQSLSPGEPATDVLATSATHTFLRSSEGILYSCGRRPVKVLNPLSVINVDAIGALGRHIAFPEDGLVLADTTVETGPNAVPIAGNGFTIFMDGTGKGYTVYFVGSITDQRGRVIVASGIKGAASAGSMPVTFDGLVRNVFPVLGGALALVEL